MTKIDKVGALLMCLGSLLIAGYAATIAVIPALVWVGVATFWGGVLVYFLFTDVDSEDMPAKAPESTESLIFVGGCAYEPEKLKKALYYLRGYIEDDSFNAGSQEWEFVSAYAGVFIHNLLRELYTKQEAVND